MTPLSLTPEQQKSFRGYQSAMANTRTPVENPTVAYFGTLGSYTEQAAIDFFGEDCRRVSHRLSEDVFKSITRQGADYGVLPIENSTTGSIAAVYDLLAKYNCYIVGETKVKIEHCLLGVPGSRLSDIREVYSHAQGFEQSGEFLAGYPDWKCLTYYNTAVAAEHVAKSANPAFAAIASRRAAAIHGLSILAEDINLSETNVTRFVIVASRMELCPDCNKISIAFHLPHVAGSLFQALSVFDANALNLCKIESRPIRDHNWEYLFFIDFIGNIDGTPLDAVMEEVISKTEGFHFLGIYKDN
ncbi:prephenate dehydratase [Eubacterium limosum]|uniref:prephenate dehydratase n=1 Tax=bioreactor metagenome TaxID=1076179 RepID=A0A645E1S3_9ZZZZ|nr:prephenate dehydratase [Eubacterium limosum]